MDWVESNSFCGYTQSVSQTKKVRKSKKKKEIDKAELVFDLYSQHQPVVRPYNLCAWVRRKLIEGLKMQEAKSSIVIQK